jgi:hypothetical protein
MPSFAWQKKKHLKSEIAQLLTTLLVNYFKSFIFKASYLVQMAELLSKGYKGDGKRFLSFTEPRF